MALSLDELKTQYDELTEAINSGALSIRHGEEFIQFRSLDEMLQLQAKLSGLIANGGAKPKPRGPSYVFQTRKGL